MIDKLAEMALGGDLLAAKLFLDRVLGPVRPRPDAPAAPVIPNNRTTAKMQESVRSLLAGQLAALEQKAQTVGLTDAEMAAMTNLVLAIQAADQNLQNIRSFGGLG